MDFWAAVLSDLKQKVSSKNFESWLQNIRLQDRTRNEVSLAVETPFLKAWIEENYLDLIDDSIESVLGRRLTVDIVVSNGSSSLEDVSSEPKTIELSGDKAAKVGRIDGVDGEKYIKALEDAKESSDATGQPPPFGAGEIDNTKRFEDFVTGDSNEFAYQATSAVAEGNTSEYNPLILYGRTATGKTHLLHAMANRCGDKEVELLSAEEFVNQYIRAIQSDCIGQLRRYWRRNCDLLLIDDVQFIADKDLSSDELLHTIDALQQREAQVVLTSDKAPSMLEGIGDRLQSRLLSGLSIEMEPAAFELRRRIVEQKIGEQSLELSDELIERIARRMGANICRLEGLIVRLGAKSKLMGTEVDRKLVDRELAQMQPERSRGVTVEFIIRRVAEEFGIEAEEIKGKSRKRHISRPRQFAMYLARTYTDKSYPALGRRFGGKDHTTVLSAYQKIEKALNEAEQEFVETIDRLENAIGV